MNEIETIRTSDFWLASTLLSVGFSVMGIDKTNLRRVNFIFERTSDIEVVLEKYWNKEITIIPQSLHQAQNDLKAKINTEYE